MQCNKCGSTIKDGLKFCTKCGADLVLTGATSMEGIKRKYCTRCGAVVDGGAFCTKCGAGVNVEMDKHKNDKIQKKPKKNKKKIIAIICIVLVGVGIGLNCFFDTSYVEQKDTKPQEEYMGELAEYVTVKEFDTEKNEVGEEMIIAKVQCPDFINIYNEVYEEINFDENSTYEEIDEVFFEKVSERLKEGYSLNDMEIMVDLTKEADSGTEESVFNDDEIRKIIRKKAAVDAFEEFCLEIIMEYAPEITEKGLIGG